MDILFTSIIIIIALSHLFFYIRPVLAGRGKFTPGGADRLSRQISLVGVPLAALLSIFAAVPWYIAALMWLPLLLIFLKGILGLRKNPYLLPLINTLIYISAGVYLCL